MENYLDLSGRPVQRKHRKAMVTANIHGRAVALQWAELARFGQVLQLCGGSRPMLPQLWAAAHVCRKPRKELWAASLSCSNKAYKLPSWYALILVKVKLRPLALKCFPSLAPAWFRVWRTFAFAKWHVHAGHVTLCPGAVGCLCIKSLQQQGSSMSFGPILQCTWSDVKCISRWIQPGCLLDISTWVT